MATSINSLNIKSKNPWIHDRNWDLKFISLSVILVAMPYLFYLFGVNFSLITQPLADLFNTSVDNVSRNVVNFSVALLIGGPHMYATWTRTYLNHDFTTKHRTMAWSSLLIPAVVITLALLNLTLLLTLFFFWASIHVLHQIIYIVELYNNKKPPKMTPFYRYTDYAVVLTALYPLAVWKIVNGKFLIGENDLGSLINDYLPVGPWMVWLVGAAFALSLGLWLVKTGFEARDGTLSWPKTIFIAVTVSVAFFVPALGNLDTAFQGMNVWHSFQYLALTWMLNHIIQKRGELNDSPFVEKMSTNGSQRRYYRFTLLLTFGTILLAGVIFSILYFPMSNPFDFAFDRAYYIAVLSFLWIHYYFDHFLFTKPQIVAQ